MPLGPYKTFGECVGAQKKKGKNDLSARKICGQIEQNTQKAAESNVRYEDNNGHLYIKAFLLDSSKNINDWGVSASSLNDRINSFIGKPLVLTENFRHPMPPEMDRVGESEYYDNDDDPYNTLKVDEIVDHWLAYQEAYRIGTIVDITEKKGTYYSIIEVTDEAAKDAFKNNDVPLFVSPAIAQLDPFEDPTHITNWTGVHLAIVSNPAYTIKKAIISGQCHGEQERCLLQLRQASVEDKKVPKLGCGFCRWDALARYAEVVKSWRTKHSVVITKDPKEFANSSIGFLKTNQSLELTDNNNQTNDTNKEQEFEKQQEKQGGDLGEQPQKGNPTPKETTTKETETETKETTTKTAEEIAIKVAGMAECVQIFQQNGVQDPQQAQQICKLAAQALMENQDQQGKTPGGGPSNGNGPPRGTGQFGSITEYEKELAKYEAKVAELTEQLKTYKKGDKTDAQRIAELEETVTNLNRAYKEKELEAYLVTKIADEELRNKKIKRFAELNLTIEDVKDIYPETLVAPKGNTGTITKKVAEVQESTSPISRVKLQVASSEDTKQQDQASNPVRERNNKIISSLLSKGGIY